MLTLEEQKSINGLEPNFWVKRYADFLFNYGISRVSDPIIVEDLVQETFLSAIKSAKNFKGQSTEKTWLTAIFKRKIVDHYRKINSRKAQLETPMNKLSEERRAMIEGGGVTEAFEMGDADIERQELASALQSCIMDLKGNQLKVFQMKTIYQMETEEICNELGISASNVWVLLHRARVQLKNCMNEKWYYED
ncbi:MAG: sigma-70 family RNA polymerase sigma factor [Flavobacteriaceae bacterium]|nr:sigma-70 family RNA polymerase sigma factor [Flavobacteriaceae bacterium]